MAQLPLDNQRPVSRHPDAGGGIEYIRVHDSTCITPYILAAPRLKPFDHNPHGACSGRQAYMQRANRTRRNKEHKPACKTIGVHTGRLTYTLKDYAARSRHFDRLENYSWKSNREPKTSKGFGSNAKRQPLYRATPRAARARARSAQVRPCRQMHGAFTAVATSSR